MPVLWKSVALASMIVSHSGASLGLCSNPSRLLASFPQRIFHFGVPYIVNGCCGKTATSLTDRIKIRVDPITLVRSRKWLVLSTEHRLKVYIIQDHTTSAGWQRFHLRVPSFQLALLSGRSLSYRFLTRCANFTANAHYSIVASYRAHS